MTSKLNSPNQEKLQHHADKAHEAWFRAKVQEALESPQQPIPHAEAMAKVQEKLAAMKVSHATGAVE